MFAYIMNLFSVAAFTFVPSFTKTGFELVYVGRRATLEVSPSMILNLLGFGNIDETYTGA